jgi:hypothetical protein
LNILVLIQSFRDVTSRIVGKAFTTSCQDFLPDELSRVGLTSQGVAFGEKIVLGVSVEYTINVMIKLSAASFINLLLSG